MERTCLGSAVVRIKAVSFLVAEQTRYFSFVLEKHILERSIYKDFKRKFDTKCHSKANSNKTTILYFKKIIAFDKTFSTEISTAKYSHSTD